MRRTTTVQRTTTLPSPPATVFAVVCSPETAALIDPAVREWRPDSRPIGVGTRFTIRGRLGSIPISGMSEVITWDPPCVAEFRSVAPTWPFRMVARHQFDDDNDGGTAYTWAISFEEVSVLGRPLIAVAAQRFRRALDAQAVALGNYLVARSAHEPLPSL